MLSSSHLTGLTVCSWKGTRTGSVCLNGSGLPYVNTVRRNGLDYLFSILAPLFILILQVLGLKYSH